MPRPITLLTSTPQDVASLRADVYGLKSRYVPPRGLEVGIPYVFHHNGDPLVPETNDKLGSPLPGLIEAWCAVLTDVAVSGTTTVELHLDGTSISALSFGVGEDYKQLDIGQDWPLGSKLQTVVTAVGSGALGLVCTVVQIASIRQ